ncbi:MAG: T9SS type A sorting domain-containing protein [Rhodothermales bacterium]|nr:T9SS type A sorting domain-containing protein [Rhodothermales bacterium]
MRYFWASARLLGGLTVLLAPGAQAQVQLGSATAANVTVSFLPAASNTTAIYAFGVGLVEQPDNTIEDLDHSAVEFGGAGGTLRVASLLGTVSLTAPHAMTSTDTLRVADRFLCTSSFTGGAVLFNGATGDQTIATGPCVATDIVVRKGDGDLVLAGPFAVNGTLTLTRGGLRLAGQTLSLAGSLGSGTIVGPGTLRLVGGETQTVGAAFQDLSTLIVDKTGVKATLSADVSLADSLIVLNGDLDLGGYRVEFGPVAGLRESTGRVLGEGTLVAQRTLNAPDEANPANLGFEITSNANLGLTTVVRGHTVQTSTGASGIARYYDVSAQQNTGLDALVRFFYRDDDLTGLTESALKLFRSTDGGATWTQEGGTVSLSRNRITLSGVDGFSRWTAGENGTLPVELVAFSATQTGDSRVTLRWTTASETNNAAFLLDVQGVDETTWREAARLDGHGTTTEQHDYAFAVDGLEAGRYRFRLRQLDTDGTLHVHDAVEAFVGMTDAVRVRVAGPNPARGTTALALAVRDPQRVTVSVVDVTGRERLRVETAELSGSQTVRIPLDVSGWGTGTYFVRVVGEGFAPLLRLVVGR